MNVRTSFAGFAALAGALVLAACSSSEPAKPAESAPAPASAPPAAAVSATPRAFFVEPAAGASLKSPVHFKFGSEGVIISAVPPDPITSVRPGTGHYHLGIDVDCLSSGTEIVKGTPAWVHFGKGDDVFDSQFAPGPHKVSLQVADDKHVAMPGLCSTMTINVTP
jgi:Domain of unknown function (DUF4399)